MFDDLKAHFIESVVSSYLAYRSERDSQSYGRSKHLRAAITASTALYHFREHIPAPNKKSRDQTAKDCPDYHIVGDVANAAKHRVLTRGKPRLTSAEDIFERTVITLYEDDAGEYSDCQTVVMVRIAGGVERDLLEVMTNVLNYWGMFLESLGVLQEYRSFKMDPGPGEGFVPREKARGMDLELTSGVRFKQEMKLLTYNPKIGRAEPMDLTGAKARIRFYKPSYTVDVQLVRPNSGEAITFSLDLDDDESLAWHSLKTDAEREAFANQLMQERRDEILKFVARKVPENPFAGE